MPPIFLSTHSLASTTPLSVVTNKHSPGRLNPLTYPYCLPRTSVDSPSVSAHIRLVGFETICIFSITGSLFQYFMPNHSLLEATFSCVTGSISASSLFEDGWLRRRCGGGGVPPPRTTVERNPAFCSASASRRCRFVDGIDVRPSLAFEAFWRWEQVCARSTRDIVAWRVERA
jgi:hypothetical protein